MQSQDTRQDKTQDNHKTKTRRLHHAPYNCVTCVITYNIKTSLDKALQITVSLSLFLFGLDFRKTEAYKYKHKAY